MKYDITKLPKLKGSDLPKILSVDSLNEHFPDKIKDIQFQRDIVDKLGGVDNYFTFTNENPKYLHIKSFDYDKVIKYGLDFDYIIDYPTNPGLYATAFYYFEQWVPIFLVEEIIEFDNNMKPLVQYINERLGPSLDGNTLLKEIENHFGQEFILNGKVIKNYHIDFYCEYDLRKDDWFLSLLNFYNYKCKLTDYNWHLQARKGKDANDRVYNENNGMCLHITDKSSAEKILKSGLLPKSKKDVHSSRVYLFSGDYNNDTNIQICLNFIRQKINSPSEYKKRLNNIFIDSNPVILKIDLNKIKDKDERPKFYDDPSFSGSKAVYCERMIPKECIIDHKEFNLEDVYKTPTLNKL